MNLALLDDLELRVGLEGKASALKQVKQLLLANVLPIDVKVLFVGLALVLLAHHEIVRLDWDPPLRIVQCDLYSVKMRVLVLTLRASLVGTVLRPSLR